MKGDSHKGGSVGCFLFAGLFLLVALGCGLFGAFGGDVQGFNRSTGQGQAMGSTA